MEWLPSLVLTIYWVVQGGVLDAGLLFVTYAYQVAFPGGAGRFDLPLATAMCILVAVFTVLISWFCIHFHKQKHRQEW